MSFTRIKHDDDDCSVLIVLLILLNFAQLCNWNLARNFEFRKKLRKIGTSENNKFQEYFIEYLILFVHYK